MANCKYCGRWNDPEDWPDYDRAEFSEACCHACYMEKPERVLDPNYDEEGASEDEAQAKEEAEDQKDINELNSEDMDDTGLDGQDDTNPDEFRLQMPAGEIGGDVP